MDHRPNDFHTATPYLMVRDAERALEYYRHAFDARELTRLTDPNGTLRNVEILIGDSPIMIGGHPELYIGEPATLANLPPVSVYLYVEDSDSWFNRAVSAGGIEIYPPTDQPYGNREGGVRDPFGIVWWIATRLVKVM
jgi:PhnB protein